MTLENGSIWIEQCELVSLTLYGDLHRYDNSFPSSRTVANLVFDCIDRIIRFQGLQYIQI